MCAIQLLELCGARLQDEINRVLFEQPGLPLPFDLTAIYDSLIETMPRASERVR